MQSANRIPPFARARCVHAVALVMIAGMLGCSDDPPPVCGAGTELVAGECLPIDDSGVMGTRDGGKPSGQAGSGAMCGGDTVQQGDACEGLKPIGAACERGRECATGTCLPESQGLPGGYCSVLDCSANRPCPAGSLCRYSSGTGHFVCLAYCDGDDDCRSDAAPPPGAASPEGGYVCQSLILNELSVCAPACTGKDICPNPTRCDEEAGRCVIDQCDPASDEPCHADEQHICYPDSRGLTESGGVCLLGCDPADPSARCAPGEVCQPLPEEPVHTGFCSPPLCTQNADCPAGAACNAGVCQPPARCDLSATCSDSGTVCVGGANGQCLPECPEDGSCGDLHPQLACADALGACLPIGSFPGSACRDERSDACDAVAVPGSSPPQAASMACLDDRCLVRCASDASVCAKISPILTCAAGIYDEPVCLPKGAFPGSPCDASTACAPLARGDQSLAMSCVQGSCAVVCDASNGGAALCAGIDASLVCADDLLGDGVDLCLPYGSFPGGPCADGNRCSTGLSCQGGRCLTDCTSGGTALCESIRTSLTCALDLYDVAVCLPKGAFPGGPCGTGNACAPLQQGTQTLATVCKAGRCLLTCDNTAGGDAFCAKVDTRTDGGLVCADNLYGDGVDLCLPRGSFPGGPCAAGNACDSGLVCKGARCLYDCSAGGNTLCTGISSTLACAPTVYDVPVCLPRGSYPGGPCDASNLCAQDLNGLAAADMRCQSSTCVVQCASGMVAPFANGDALCGVVSSTLTCVDTAGPQAFCTLKCGAANTCPTGLSCLTSQQACLPTGSFLTSPCATGNVCSTAPPIPLACVPGGSPTCAASCSAGDNTYCMNLNLGFTQCQTLAPGLSVCTP